MKQVTDKSVDTVTMDKISTFILGRYTSSMKAAWRLQEFPICYKSNSVLKLAVHT